MTSDRLRPGATIRGVDFLAEIDESLRFDLDISHMAAEREMSPLGMVFFSLPFVGLGGLMLARALGLVEFLGPVLVPNWVLGLGGLAFLAPGLLILFYGLDVRRSGGGLLLAAAVLAFAAVFHYGVFGQDLRHWSGPDIGPFSAGELARIGVVTIDLAILSYWIALRTTFVDGQPGTVWKRMEGWDPSRKKMLWIGFQLLPLGIALLLHFTGVLDRIGAIFR